MDPRPRWVAGGGAGRAGALRGATPSPLKAIAPPAGEAGPHRRLHHWRERERRDGWRKRHRGRDRGSPLPDLPRCRTATPLPREAEGVAVPLALRRGAPAESPAVEI